MSLIDHVKSARRVSTPILSIGTPDPAATITTICEGINGDAPKIQWDVVRGLKALNDEGLLALCMVQPERAIEREADEPPFFCPTTNNPTAMAAVVKELPRESVVFVHNSQKYLKDPAFIQGVWNLRDLFKQDKRMLILLGPSSDLPVELQGDVIALDEALPNAEEIEAIVARCHDSVELTVTGEVLDKAVEALTGLPAFQIEQITAMSLKRSGLDLPALWERKRRQIEQTPGLKVYREGDTFDGIGGCEVIKSFLNRIMDGKRKPNAIVFIDEIEKMLAGTGDSSGVTQDQLGSLLAYMQDNAASGMIFVGPPGAAKSAIAKAAGNEGGIPTIQLDLGAAKGSLVGQSEQQLRTALKVISSVSNNRSLWIATCNKIADLPPELRRRFTLGTYFFDLPDEGERERIWQIYLEKYCVDPGDSDCEFSDDGWTGAEIKQACDIADMLQCEVWEAAKFVIPVSVSASAAITKLQEQADGKFLSASYEGVYRRHRELNGKPARQIDLN